MQQANTKSGLNNISFYDDDFGIIVCDSSTFLITTNGGTNWVKSTFKFKYNNIAFTSVFFKDMYDIWITGFTLDSTRAIIMRSTDLGNTWVDKTKNIFGLSLYSPIYDLCFTKNGSNFTDIGYVLIKSALLMQTTDNGNNWKSIYLSNYFPGNKIYFIENEIDKSIQIWVIADNGLIMTTSDDFATNKVIQTPTKSNLISLTNNNGIIRVLTQDGIILTTNDYGNTWGKTILDTLSYYYDLKFADDKYGWVASLFGRFYHTTNGGLTWEKHQTKFNNYNFYAISMKNRNLGWAIGLDNLILKYTNTTSIEDEPQLISNITLSTQIELYDILGRSIATFQSYEKLKAEIENYPPPHLIKWRDEKGISHFEKIK